MPWLPDQLYKTVIPIGVPSQEEQFRPQATGFLVVRKRPNIDRGDIFLITNRHVFQQKEEESGKWEKGFIRPWPWLRLHTTEEGKAIHKYPTLYIELNEECLRFHPDERVDLAAVIIPVSVDPQIKMEHLDIKALDETLISEEINPGDDVCYLGYPTSVFPHKTLHNQPLLRRGCVSLVPQAGAYELADVGVFLIEGWIFPGNSGGPVFFRSSVFHESGGIDLGRGQAPKLLGIVSSYIPYRDVAVSQQTRRPRVVFEENSGLFLALKAKRITELLDHILRPGERKLRVIPRPAEKTRTILQLEDKSKTMIITGVGHLDFVCGKCGSFLAKSVEFNQIIGMVLLCNKCGAYNDTEMGI